MTAFIVRSGPPLLAPAAREQALMTLSAPERMRFVSEPDHRRESFLAGRSLLRSLAGEMLGIDPADVPLVATCPDCTRVHGRPLIQGTDLQVSLSHSPVAVVAAAAWGASIGIDVEPADTRVDELAVMIDDPSVLRWTRIEAVLKADGRGLRVDPAAVVVEPHPEGAIAWIPDAPARYLVHEVELDVAPGVSASVAIEIR